MEQLLAKIKAGLSPQQLHQLKHNVPVFTNDQIEQHGFPAVGSPDQDFVLFYPLMRIGNNESGHYCAVIQSLDPNRIHYYDPYGLIPHGITKTSPQRQGLGYLNRQKGILGRLINDHRIIDYSPFAHQIDNPQISTCGRHCLLRLTNRHLNHEQYDKRLK